MNSTLEYIKKKYGLSFDVPVPITLSGFHRYYQLVDLFKELGFTKGAEIGVEKGQFAEILCQGIPNLKLYCIDPWMAYEEYKEIWARDQGRLDYFFEQTKKRLSGYNCEMIRKTSMEAVTNFEQNSLDFVFIDGNHDFTYVVNDIAQWVKIVRPGGILAGHDYFGGTYKGKTPIHVKYAVRGYTKAYQIRPWFVLHHPGTMDCWMWVKQ